MAQTEEQLLLVRQRQRETSGEMAELREALTRCNVELHQAYLGFNSTCEEELIESYIFEINALQARYSYLLRRVKELEGVR